MTTGRCRSFKHPKHTNTVLGVNPAPTAEFAPLARLGSELRDAPKRDRKRDREEVGKEEFMVRLQQRGKIKLVE